MLSLGEFEILCFLIFHIYFLSLYIHSMFTHASFVEFSVVFVKYHKFHDVKISEETPNKNVTGNNKPFVCFFDARGWFCQANGKLHYLQFKISKNIK